MTERTGPACFTELPDLLRDVVRSRLDISGESEGEDGDRHEEKDDRERASEFEEEGVKSMDGLGDRVAVPSIIILIGDVTVLSR